LPRAFPRKLAISFPRAALSSRQKRSATEEVEGALFLRPRPNGEVYGNVAHHPECTRTHPNAPERTRMHRFALNAPKATAPSRSECTRMHPGAPECTLFFAFRQNEPTASPAWEMIDAPPVRIYHVNRFTSSITTRDA
jgi:hypothetical protein